MLEMKKQNVFSLVIYSCCVLNTCLVSSLFFCFSFQLIKQFDCLLMLLHTYQRQANSNWANSQRMSKCR